MTIQKNFLPLVPSSELRVFQRKLSAAAVSAALLSLAPAGAAWAADYHFIGTNPLSQRWDQAASWDGGVVPGSGDRAVFSGTITQVRWATAQSIGSVWITETSGLATLNITGVPSMTIAGLDGVGVQSDANRMISFFRLPIMAGDFSIRATNAAGGGFNFFSTTGATDSGIRTEGHTLTFDTVNAANQMFVHQGYGISGSGSVVKTGAGLLTFESCAACDAFPTTLFTYTGSTWVQQGTLALTGIASLRYSSEVRVDGTLDISGTTEETRATLETPGGTSIKKLLGSGSVVLGARNLTLTEGGTNFSGGITGTGALILQAGGTTLSGASDYSGGTRLMSGRLDVGHGSALGTGALDMADGTTLGFVADGLNLANDIVLSGTGDPTIDTGSYSATLSGGISGAGFLTKEGAGTLTLSGANTYTGATTVTAGTLAAGAANVLSSTSAHTVASGATLALLGHSQAIASMNNSGTVTLAGSAPGATLTVAGAWVGNGGTLEVGTVLGDDSSVTDRLVVSGNTSGTTSLRVLNQGGGGAQTVEGIKVVDVGGTSDGVFSLANGSYTFNGQPAIVAGAYAYTLQKNGVANPADGDWYLRSAYIAPAVDPSTPTTPTDPGSPTTSPVVVGPIYQPGVPVYELYARGLQALNGLPTLQQRVGNRQWAGSGVADGTGAWGRIEGEHGRSNAAHSTSSADSDIDRWKAQLGVDRGLYQGPNGDALVGGLTGYYGGANSDVHSVFGNGSIDTTGYGLGATLTWYGAEGFYADAQAQYSRFDSDLSSNSLGALAKGNNGTGKAASLEVGKRWAIGERLAVTPQVQLAWSDVDFDSFADPNGALISNGDGRSLKGRVGIGLDHQSSGQDAAGKAERSHVYGIVNLSYEFSDGTHADVSGVRIVHEDERLWGGLGVGGSYGWAGDRYTLYAEVSANTALRDFGSSYSLWGTAGFRMQF